MFITCKTSANVYKTMIRPLLEYVDFIVDSGSKYLITNVRFEELNFVANLKIGKHTRS